MESCPGAERHAVANVPRRALDDRPREQRRGARALTAAAFRVRVGPAPWRHVQHAWGAGQRRPGRGVSRQQTRRTGPAPAARHARWVVPDGADHMGPQQLLTRGSVFLQSARDVRLTNALAGRYGASSRDRRRRRGLRRVAATTWAEPVEMSARQQRERSRKRPQQETRRPRRGARHGHRRRPRQSPRAHACPHQP